MHSCHKQTTVTHDRRVLFHPVLVYLWLIWSWLVYLMVGLILITCGLFDPDQFTCGLFDPD